MANNAEDGYDGYTINQIAAAIPVSLNFQPNIVLLHAGNWLVYYAAGAISRCLCSQVQMI